MTEVISVRFRGGCKEYYFDPHGIAVKAGGFVIVETAQGTEFAQCLAGNHEVDDRCIVRPLRAVLRVATEADKHAVENNRRREKEAFEVCQRKIGEHGLEMKLVRVECSFDGNKIVFFFTSEGRVDFRELVRDLASVFRARIELRQIGVRDEAKMLGGLGICGRPFCCAQFLDDFVPVSIKMAKTQNLSLNPTKISGACGRLMCCLKYEQSAYEDAVKRMPKNDSFVLTPDGAGNVSSVNLVRETVNVRLDESPESQKCYHNCEICVLRNGKGSRDGIEIPSERPTRYVKQDDEQESMPSPVFRSMELYEEALEAEQESAQEGEKRERRRRGGRGKRGGRGHGGEKSVETAREQRTEKSSEKPNEKSAEKGDRRGGARRNPEKKSAAVPVPTEKNVSAERAEGEKSTRRRNHHRGGRGRRGGRGDGTAPRSSAE